MPSGGFSFIQMSNNFSVKILTLAQSNAILKNVEKIVKLASGLSA